MRQEEAIRREHEVMEELARISQELDAIDTLIYRFGQASQRWFNPEMVRRLSRARARLLEQRRLLQGLRAHYAQYI